ncbi:hypothetical protein M0Q50_06250 [bacterium]|jgi:hypothetical protein|nr:hypothetical protein [bacterium]
MQLKDIVKDNVVNFSHYRASYLYYNVIVDDIKYSFPVPIEDIGDATFLNQDKAIIFMRYIRKSLDDNTFVRSN